MSYARYLIRRSGGFGSGLQLHCSGRTGSVNSDNGVILEEPVQDGDPFGGSSAIIVLGRISPRQRRHVEERRAFRVRVARVAMLLVCGKDSG